MSRDSVLLEATFEYCAAGGDAEVFWRTVGVDRREFVSLQEEEARILLKATQQQRAGEFDQQPQEEQLLLPIVRCFPLHLRRPAMFDASSESRVDKKRRLSSSEELRRSRSLDDRQGPFFESVYEALDDTQDATHPPVWRKETPDDAACPKATCCCCVGCTDTGPDAPACVQGSLAATAAALAPLRRALSLVLEEQTRSAQLCLWNRRHSREREGAAPSAGGGLCVGLKAVASALSASESRTSPPELPPEMAGVIGHPHLSLEAVVSCLRLSLRSPEQPTPSAPQRNSGTLGEDAALPEPSSEARDEWSAETTTLPRRLLRQAAAIATHPAARIFFCSLDKRNASLQLPQGHRFARALCVREAARLRLRVEALQRAATEALETGGAVPRGARGDLLLLLVALDSLQLRLYARALPSGALRTLYESRVLRAAAAVAECAEDACRDLGEDAQQPETQHHPDPHRDPRDQLQIEKAEASDLDSSQQRRGKRRGKVASLGAAASMAETSVAAAGLLSGLPETPSPRVLLELLAPLLNSLLTQYPW